MIMAYTPRRFGGRLHFFYELRNQIIIVPICTYPAYILHLLLYRNPLNVLTVTLIIPHYFSFNSTNPALIIILPSTNHQYLQLP